MDLVGKTSKDRNQIVIVGTQVLEQSLDIDFDILFTEKCPIDLFFQRLGRLHRHKRDKRPEKLANPECYILNDLDACKNAEKVYSKFILKRTDSAMKEKNILCLPDDIRCMTEQVYKTDSKTDDEDEIAYSKERKLEESKAKTFLLPPEKKCRFKGMLDVRNVGTGSVRDGMNNLDIILLRRTGPDLETITGKPVFDGTKLTGEAAGELLKSQISVPYSETLFKSLEKIKTEKSYQQIARLLKQHPLTEEKQFLIFDENGTCRVNDTNYSYSSKYGWRAFT